MYLKQTIEGVIGEVRKAFRLKREFEILLPGFMEKALPAWGRLMWKMGSPGGSDLIARQYVRLLEMAISARNYVRRVIK